MGHHRKAAIRALRARPASGPARDLSPPRGCCRSSSRSGWQAWNPAGVASFVSKVGAQQGNSYLGATGIPPASRRAAVTLGAQGGQPASRALATARLSRHHPGVAKPRAFARGCRAVSRADMTRGAGGPGRGAFQRILRGARHAPAWNVLVPSGRFSPRLETGDGCVTVNLGRLDGP